MSNLRIFFSDSNSLLLILPLAFLYLAYKYRDNKYANVVLLFYAIGALAGYILTQHDLYPFMNNIGHPAVCWEAVLFLLLGCLILFYPILKGTIVYNVGTVNEHNFILFSYFLILISILYSVQVIPYITLTFDASDFVSYKDEVMSEGGLKLAGNNVFFARILGMQVTLRPFITFMFCYAMAELPGNAKIKWMLGYSAIAVPVLHSLGSAHRNVLVFSFIDIILCYILFKNRYSNNIRRFLSITIVTMGVSVTLVVIVFALFRFNDGNGYVEYSLYRYLGEPFVNFNTLLWNTNEYMYGNKSFPILRGLMGYDYIKPLDMRDYYSDLTYYSYFFYSIIGHFYMDFGPYWCIIILLVISFFFSFLLYKMKQVGSLSYYLLLFLYATFTLRNYFYFAFMGDNNKTFLWLCFFYVFFYKFIDAGHREKHCLEF